MHEILDRREYRDQASTLRVQLACAWSGAALLIGFLAGWAWLAGMIPPTAPTDTPGQIQAFFAEDVTRKRIGILLAMTVWSLLVPWGAVVAARTTRAEHGFPLLSVIQVMCATSTTALGVLMMMLWGVIAFRPEDMAPDTARMLNDLAWFIFLIDWAPVTVWVWAFAAAVLIDRREHSGFPRWLGYLSLWTGLIFFPAGLVIFFKTGPFAYDGLLALYLPGAVFFLWLAAVTVAMLRLISRELSALAH